MLPFSARQSHICFMKNILNYFAISLLLAIVSSCKKEEDPHQPAATVFSFSCLYSFVFEHSGTKSLAVSVQSESNKEFFATFETVPSNFGYFESPVSIAGNQSGALNIDFYQTLSSPGAYSAIVMVSTPGENNAIRTKNISLVYRPNCLYNFRSHI